MATSKGIVNGVNVDTLFGIIDAIGGNPKIADFKFSITNKWSNGGHNISNVGNFYGALETQTRDGFVVENAEHQVLLGEDQSPNPVEYVLHALAGCLTSILVYHAAARGHKITDVESTVEGNLDLHGFLGMDEKVRSGYNDIKVTIKVKGDLSEAELQELMKVAQARSPVYDMVTNPVPVAVEIVK
jgi:uncharacterized OsmC-like protein